MRRADGVREGTPTGPRDSVADVLTRHGVPYRTGPRGIRAEGTAADAANTLTERQTPTEGTPHA